MLLLKKAGEWQHKYYARIAANAQKMVHDAPFFVHADQKEFVTRGKGLGDAMCVKTLF